LKDNERDTDRFLDRLNEFGKIQGKEPDDANLQERKNKIDGKSSGQNAY
jgi:hypothetical protein